MMSEYIVTLISGEFVTGSRCVMQCSGPRMDGHRERYRSPATGTFTHAGFSQIDGMPVLYLYFRDGSVGGTRQSNFGWPATHFRPPDGWVGGGGILATQYFPPGQDPFLGDTIADSDAELDEFVAAEDAAATGEPPEPFYLDRLEEHPSYDP